MDGWKCGWRNGMGGWKERWGMKWVAGENGWKIAVDGMDEDEGS